MLREQREIRSGPASWPSRILNISLVVVASLAAAGIRGPFVPPEARAQDQPAAPAQAVQQPATENPLDLVPETADMAVVLRPSAMLAVPGLAAMLDELDLRGPLEKAYGLPPEQMELFVVVWLRDAPREPFRATIPPPSAAILRSTGPRDWAAFVREAVTNPVEARFAGHSYVRPANAPWGTSVRVVDDRTVVLAPTEAGMQQYLGSMQRAPRGHSWDEAASRVAPGQILLATSNAWMIQSMQEVASQPGSTLGMVAPLWTQALSHAVSIDLSAGVKLEVVSVSGDEAGAGQVADTLQAVVTLLRNTLAQAKSQASRDGPPIGGPAVAWNQVVGPFLPLSEPMLTGARVQREANVTRLQASSDVALADLTRAVAPVLASARSRSQRFLSLNNLKQIALAMHMYADANGGRFPPAVSRGPNGSQPPHSWRVALLPYLGQEELYRQYHLDEPWDSEHNRELIGKMPTVFRHPKDQGDGATVYHVLTGTETIFPAQGPAGKFSDVGDGLSNTVLVIEAGTGTPWTKPEDIPFLPGGKLMESLGLPDSRDGFCAAMGDGSARFIGASVHPAVLDALATRDGGEVISPDAIPGADPQPTAAPVPYDQPGSRR